MTRERRSDGTHHFSRRGALLVLLGSSLFAGVASARNLWERTRSPRSAHETRVLAAVERVLLGRADDHDVVLAQAAYVDYARGESFDEVRVELSLVRMRLAARWVYDSLLEKRLQTTLKRAVPPAQRGRGLIDYGALSALRGDADATIARMSQALDFSWEGEPRAHALLGRGYAHMARGRAREAVDDFSQAASVADSLRLEAAALASLALAQSRSGRTQDALQNARAALEVDARRTSTLGRDLFDEVARSPSYEAFAVNALLEEAHAAARREALDDEGEARARTAACEAQRKYLLHAEPDGAPWVSWAKRRWLACSSTGAAPDYSGDHLR